MKKIIIPIGALLMTGMFHAQLSTTENYVYSKTYLSDPTLPNVRTSETVQYFDGLGRPKQVVNIKASPQGKDVVTHIEYDGFGRQVKDYLPVPQGQTLNGAIVPTPLANATQAGIYGQEKIYAEKALENSPLNRLMEQRQVGTAWSTKPVLFGYLANTATDVRKYITITTPVENRTNSKLMVSPNDINSASGYYKANQLYKNSVKDEDGNETIEFKNGQGQIVLVRKVISTTDNADTYYIYNEYNQLAFVVPPNASFAIKGLGVGTQIADTDPTLNDLCYQYRYDGKGRLVEKKLPGKGWEYIIYDKADRVVMTQDANLKGNNQWLVTEYDVFNRIAYTGLINNATARNDLQTYINNNPINNAQRISSFFTLSGMNVYYTSSPTVTLHILLSVNYYDTYPVGSPAVTNAFAQDLLTDNPANKYTTKGLPVASYVKNIEDDNWTKNFTWYDTKGRVIGSNSKNHLGGYTVLNHNLDFSGVVLQTNTYHKRLATDTEIITRERFTYDPQNRLLTQTHQVNNNPIEILAQNDYNELSQLRSKKVGGVTAAVPLQQIDYKYNIRGWMTQINDPATLGSDLFGYAIRYNDPIESVGQASFNGNITEIDWNTKSDNTLRRYDYNYDTLNRFVSALYTKPNSSVTQTGSYNEWATYDLNGNIKTMGRYGNQDANTPILIDHLQYTYSGNRLLSIKDISQNLSGYPYLATPNTISYDDNGNMTDHLDKGINKINYNFLNLPNNIKKSPGVQGTTTKYFYRADGVKLKKDLSGGLVLGINQIEYLDGFQYNLIDNQICVGCTPPSPVLQFVPTSEGYYDFVKNKYIYNYTDHLGNVRVSYTKNGLVVDIIEENNYYPFGLKHEGYNNLAGNPYYYQYKYNGKELQTETGMYDYGARMYMPDIGRWGVVDPLAEKMTRFSPYNYAFSNPIRFIDPDGRENKDWVKNGRDDTWHYRSDITSASEAATAGYTSYANGRGDDNSKYDTPMSSNGVDTGVDKKVVLGEGGNYTVNGESFKAHDEAPYVSSKEVDKVGKVLAGQAYVPAFIISGGSGSVVMDYLTGSALRGATDLSTQTYFKGGIKNIDKRQLFINTFAGGGNSLQTMGYTGLANLSLNTANNFGTSYFGGTGSLDVEINTVKIFTGVLGNAAGVLGGNTLTNTLLPSVYMNGLDKVLNNANDKYNKNNQIKKR